jgi:hypothetical protein
VRFISTKAHRLACTAAVAAICLIGWVGKATLAQDPAKDSAPLPPSEASTAALSLPQELDVPKVEAAKPAAAGVPGSSPLIPGVDVPPLSAEAAIAPANVVVPGSAVALSPASDSEDPEKAAVAFVEQNQKLAESQLKSLKAEETKLRARLQKVEGGIKRWETLLGALKQSQGSVAVVIPGNFVSWKKAAPDSEPQHLEPVGTDAKGSAIQKK